MAEKFKVVTRKLYLWWLERLGTIPRCKVCGKMLQIGDEYYVTRYRRKTKYYHRQCWESLFIDVPDNGEVP